MFFLEKMAEVNQAKVKIVNIHWSRINVMKFDDTNNWKGKGDIKKSKTDNYQLRRNQYAY